MKKILMVMAALAVGGLTACGGGDTTGPTTTPTTTPSPTPTPAPAGYFSLADATVTVVNNGPAASTSVVATRYNGHSDTISLSPANVPSGLTVTLAKNALSSSETQVQVNVLAKDMAPGNYKFNLNGVSGEQSKSSIVNVRVTPAEQATNVSNVKAYFYASLGQVDVTWSSVTGAIKYHVDRKCGTEDYTEIGTSVSILFTDKAPIQNSTCIYRVRVEGKDGISSGVEAAPISTYQETLYVSAAANSTSIMVSWSTVTGATGYKLDRKTTGGSYAEIASLPAGTTSYTDTALSAGQTYTYRVRTVIGASISLGKESYPTAYSGTPLPTPPGTPPSPTCCKVCTSGKPCGNTCIAANKKCNTPGGCACSGSIPVVWQKLQDCKGVPAIGLNENGEEVYLGTFGDWVKQFDGIVK